MKWYGPEKVQRLTVRGAFAAVGVALAGAALAGVTVIGSPKAAGADECPPPTSSPLDPSGHVILCPQPTVPTFPG